MASAVNSVNSNQDWKDAAAENAIKNFKIAAFATALNFRRNPATGLIFPFTEDEIPFPGPEYLDAQNSLDLARKPSPATEPVKGDPNNLPFEPATAGLVLEREEYAAGLVNGTTANEQQKPIVNTKESLLKPLKIAWKDFIDSEIKPNWKEIEESINKEIEVCSKMTDIFSDEALVNPLPSSSSPAKSENNQISEEVIENVIKEQKASIVELKIGNIPASHGRLASTEYAKVLNVEENMPKFEELVPSPAYIYPFELDSFQKQAILCLEAKENVFVAAHTSAGKTVVAEYAIALSIKCNSTRCVYTSPIKALSNQKFRDFCSTFGNSNVGILTGDVQVRAEAPCLIMTTEILLQMLYRGASMIRDIEWVIFDEVHYVNDSERGHVWEEVFIMLPEHVRLVLLSATVPNVVDFADWLGRVRRRPTHVVFTTKRPVPLEHYLYLGKDGHSINERYQFIDENSNWLEDGYRAAVYAKKNKPQNPYRHGNNEKNDRNVYRTVIKHLQNEEKLPVIVFIFSRKRCDQLATLMRDSLDLTTNEEKGRITRFIHKSIRKLKKIDRSLPQVKMMVSLLRNGFGIHHSGILPLLKEITEILFTDGLVRVLFATETFAMGINMPARTVLFDNLRKHDGKNFRDLESSEYIQMAGRAGRRGKDKTGYVYVLCKQDPPEQSDLMRITKGKATPLKSQFRLTYSMLLNNLRAREHIRIESIMEKSFGEHEQQRVIPSRSNDIQRIQKEISAIKIGHCEFCSDLKEFCLGILACRSLREKIMPKICRRLIDRKKAGPGRLLLVEMEEHHPFMVAVIISSCKIGFDIMAIKPEKLSTFRGENLSDFSELEPIFKRISFERVVSATKVVIPNVSQHVWREKDTKSWKKRENTQECILEMARALHNRKSAKGAPFLETINYIYDLDMRNLDEAIQIEEYMFQFGVLFTNKCVWCEEFILHYKLMMDKTLLESQLYFAKHQLSRQSLGYYPEYECKLKVLKKLNYVTDDDDMCLMTKGRVGCLISEFEIILTELLTDNVFTELPAPYIASLLSCLVFRLVVTDCPPALDSTMQEVNFLHLIYTLLNGLTFLDVATNEIDSSSDHDTPSRIWNAR